MAVLFPLPQPWASRGWKLKIRDRERVEPPHVSLIFRVKTWRFGLRDNEFLDGEPDPGEVDKALVQHLLSNLEEFVAAWDTLYPHNPVRSA
jgi:hypothetical protein